MPAALAALGRVGECEAELDLALTAARAADDRRRVTAVLGSAPTAALWGPSPVPRAGGRCLDVIRLLRITTASPAVEAVSVRCQAVLEGLRGRFDTARTMLESSRATAEELGLRQSLMVTELYAGIVELLAGQPEVAEPHLRAAYGGLGQRGISADAGQAAAHLARSLLLQERIDEAEELAAEADALAGQNIQTAIAANAVMAEILSARGDHAEAVGARRGCGRPGRRQRHRRRPCQRLRQPGPSAGCCRRRSRRCRRPNGGRSPLRSQGRGGEPPGCVYVRRPSTNVR